MVRLHSAIHEAIMTQGTAKAFGDTERAIADVAQATDSRPGRRAGVPARLAAKAFAKNKDAAAAVEFALIALVSLELLVEAMQAGLYFYTSAGVERATSKATRAIITGSVNNQNLTAAQFRANVLCPAISATNLSCNNVITNVQTVSEALSPGGFYTLVNSAQNGLVRPPLDNTKTSYCIGTANDYVFVQILYAMPVFSPIWKVFSTNFNGTPSFIVQSTAAFRNEPFQAGTASC